QSDHTSTLSFLFYRAVTHLDLHSFPTRRSSDLGKIAKCTLNHFMNTTPIYLILACLCLLMTACEEKDCFTHPEPFVFEFVDADGDRKSTRLNSSHVKISYAVFCLKKKKRRTQ